MSNLEMSFGIGRIFNLKKDQRIAWALHTTMNLEKKYQAALLAKQFRLPVDQALRLNASYETAFFYHKSGDSPVLGKGSVPKSIPLDNVKAYTYGVEAKLPTANAAVQDEGTGEENPYREQTFHAKLSLVCIEDNKKSKTYRLAVYSKNCTFSNYAEVAVLMDLDISNSREKTSDGEQLQGFFKKLYASTEESGKGWLEARDLQPEGGSLYEQLQYASLKLRSGTDSRQVHIHFGGCGLTPLHMAMDFLRCDYRESVVLTPPSFIVQSAFAAKFFREHHFLYDLEAPKAEALLSQTDAPSAQTAEEKNFPAKSHAKLYLLKHSRKEEEQYSLWLGSANCTVQGIGCDFKSPIVEVPHQSIECLVEIPLDKTEFDAVKSQLLKDPENPASRGYVLFENLEKADPSEHSIDFWGKLLATYGEIVALSYRDKNGVFRKPADLKGSDRLSEIRYTVQINEAGAAKWRAESASPEKQIEKVCYVQPMEYGFAAMDFPELDESDITHLVFKPREENQAFGFQPCQGLVCVGTSGAVMEIPDHLLQEIKRPKGLITLATAPYLSRMWSCESSEQARRYLTTCRQELLKAKQSQTGENTGYDKALAAVEYLKHVVDDDFVPQEAQPQPNHNRQDTILKVQGIPSLAALAGAPKDALKPFQDQGAKALSALFIKHSRAFLADEAGLGKTFTATKTMCLEAEKQWQKQGKGNETPFYALYVGPNTALLDKCCSDIVKAFSNISWPEDSIMQGARLDYWPTVHRLSELWGPLLMKDPNTLPFRPKPKNLPPEERKSTPVKREEMPTGKTILLIATSVELMGARSQSQGKENDALLTIAENALKPWAKNKNYDFVVTAIDGFTKELDANAKRKEKNNTPIVVKNDDGTMKETYYLPPEPMVYKYTNEVRSYVEQLLLQKFGLVMLDEYHRYFGKLDKKLHSAYWAEKNYETKLLFISATPYQSFKTKNLDLDTAAEEDDVGLNQLPEFGRFLEKVYCQGRGFAGDPSKTQKEQVSALVENYSTKEETYKNALNEFLHRWQVYADTLELEDYTQKQIAYAKADSARYAFEAALRQRMIRHERTLLSEEKIPEEHVLLGAGAASLEQYKQPIYNVFRQRMLLKEAKFSNVVLNWSEHMPWLLSFAIKNGHSKDESEAPLPYYLELEQMSRSVNAELFLEEESIDSKAVLQQEQILRLPEKTVAFRDICTQNISEAACQRLWMVPTVPAYSVEETSVFSGEEANTYSKLLVFDEHRFLQRGGAALLSQYADAMNRTAKTDGYDALLKNLVLPFADKDIDITELAKRRIPDNSSLDEILSAWTAAGNDRLTERQALAALADPAVCVMRLGYDEESAKTVAKAFDVYLKKDHSRLALAAWMAAQEVEQTEPAVQLAVLRYCAEGNLFAVLREWFAITRMSKQDEHIQMLCECLERAHSDVKVYVQTKEDYENQGKGRAGICCSCGFAEQLTADHHDVGTASGTASENAHKGIRNAFNSPFWPMVLFVGRGAQEGLDFHKYCLRIMHLTLPKGAVSFDQRQGRIDRFRSLLVRRRACELLGLKTSASVDVDDAMFQTLNDWKDQEKSDCPSIWKTDQIFPDWQIKEKPGLYESAHHFQRMVPVLEFTDEMLEYQQLSNQLKSYRSTIGSADIAIPNDYRHLQINLTAK